MQDSSEQPSTSTDTQPAEHAAAHGSRTLRWLEEAAFIAALGMAFVGMALTNATPATGYRYWVFTTALFGLASIIATWLAEHRERGQGEGQDDWRSIWRQVPFWLLVLAAMFVIRALVGEGRITFAAAGFISMLLMGLALALDGLVASGWRFALLGLALMGMTLLTAWFAAYMWLLIPLALLTWWIAHLVDKHLPHPARPAQGKKG